MHDKIEEHMIPSPMGPENEFEAYEQNDTWGVVYNVGQVTHVLLLGSCMK